MSTSQIRPFPITSSVLSTLATRATKSPLSIPRPTTPAAPLGMLTPLVYVACFVAGLYIATQMYSGALFLLDAQLPRAFGCVFAAAYVFQLGVGYLEHREERRWREERRGG